MRREPIGLPRIAFDPPPDVGSALVTLRLPGQRAALGFVDSPEAEENFLDFVKLSFSQKRKTLVNNLRSLTKPDAVRQALEKSSLRPDARAEQLTVAQLGAVFKLLS